MTAKGVIRLKVNNEEVNLTTDCSRNAFIELTKDKEFDTFGRWNFM